MRRDAIAPTLFFLAAILYEELLLKLICFSSLSFSEFLFTFLFTLPPAMLFGLLCVSVTPRRGRQLLLLITAVVSLWIGAQAIYYRLFKTFLSLFSVTKMAMVAGAFGGMAVNEILLNWLPILLLSIPFFLSFPLGRRLIPDTVSFYGFRIRWLMLTAAVQLTAMGIVLCCGGGALSVRNIYFQAASPELEMQHFGALTQAQLELHRVAFGITPTLSPNEPPASSGASSSSPAPDTSVPPDDPPAFPEYDDSKYHVLPLAFDRVASDEAEYTLLDLNQWISRREPAETNQWTGYFEGKNLIWIVAEGFSTLAMDPQRTPVLWELSHNGFVFEHFYTPLWGVSTSDGEYITTTSLIPKSGVWSYSLSSENYMPLSLGNQFRKLGYRTMAFHNYLYDYYDRDLSHPNMGYEYFGLGQGLAPADIIPEEYLEAENQFPASDRMMMDAIVPMFAEEEQFMVYCLTVSGHLPYSTQENNMSALHWDEVQDLPYSDGVKAYLASQMELELAMESLIRQLSEAGKLEDTVIVLSADHYPYGLTDEEYSELLGHPVDSAFERYENTLILWNAQMTQPVVVDKYCSSLDILPTLSNLFGLDYDSRLFMGSDILSGEEPLVIFSNYSFINGDGWFNSGTDLFTRWDGLSADRAAVSEMIAEVQRRIAYSAAILDHDYYRLVLNGPPKEDSLFDFPDFPWQNEDRPEHSHQP